MRHAAHLGILAGISALHSSWKLPHALSPAITPGSPACTTTLLPRVGRTEAAGVERPAGLGAARAAAAVHESAAQVEAILKGK